VAHGVAGLQPQVAGIVRIECGQDNRHSGLMKFGGVVESGPEPVKFRGKVAQGLQDDGHVGRREPIGPHPRLFAPLNSEVEVELLRTGSGFGGHRTVGNGETERGK
jgi:hypothetical protein